MYAMRTYLKKISFPINEQFWTISNVGRGRGVTTTDLNNTKKGERYSKTISWIRGKISFSIIRSALLCLRGTRTLDIETGKDIL